MSAKLTVIPANEWVPVTSSNIAQIKYDPKMGWLWVLFHGKAEGGTGEYAYIGVPGDVVLDLVNARSAGKFFYANIHGKYKTMKEITTP